MRRTMRHVAVLAAATVMLTAISVPAQGKGGVGVGRPIDVMGWTVNCATDTLFAYAYDEKRPPAYANAELYVEIERDGYRDTTDTASGTGALDVQAGVGEVQYSSWTVWFILFALDDQGVPVKILDEVLAFNGEVFCQ